MWVWIPHRWGVFDTTLCHKVCQWFVTSQWFSRSTLVSFTYKTDQHDITEILLKVALNTIIKSNQIQNYFLLKYIFIYFPLFFQSEWTSWSYLLNIKQWSCPHQMDSELEWHPCIGEEPFTLWKEWSQDPIKDDTI